MFSLGWLTAAAIAAAYAYTLPQTPQPDWRCGAVWHATRPAYDEISIAATGPLNWVCPQCVSNADSINSALEAMREWDRWSTAESKYLVVEQEGVPVLAFTCDNPSAPYGVILDLDAFALYLSSKQKDCSWEPTL